MEKGRWRRNQQDNFLGAPQAAQIWEMTHRKVEDLEIGSLKLSVPSHLLESLCKVFWYKHTAVWRPLCMLSHFSCVQLCNPMYGLWLTRLLSPWDSPDKNAGVGCHFLLQGIFLIQGQNPRLLRLLHCREILYTEPLGKSLKTTVLAHSSTTFKYILRICAPSFYLVCQSSTICWTFFQLLGLQHPKKTKFLPSTLVEETDNKLSEFDSVPHWAWHGMDMAVRNGKLRLLLILKHCCLVSPVTCKGRGYWDLHPKFPLHQAEYQAHNRLSMQIWLISWVKLQVIEIVFIFPKCLTQLSFKGEIL